MLEKTKENIIGTLNYNGLIIDDLEALLQDMKRAQHEAKQQVRICDRCAENKFVQENICKRGKAPMCVVCQEGKKPAIFLTDNQAYTPKTAQADQCQGCGAKRSTRRAWP